MDFIGPVFSIVLFDLILSGDNAVVIGLAAHSLPARQRRLAIIIGGVAAVLLRVTNTSVASFLLALPVVKIVGGLLLSWIAFKLLKGEEEKKEHLRVATTMREAIQTILIADFIMSLDNVLAIAAVARGHLWLLMFGLALSMPLVLFGGSLIAALVDRVWWLAYVGAALIVWTGAEMVLEDTLVHDISGDLGLLRWPILAVAVVAVLAFSHWFHRRPSRAQIIIRMRSVTTIEEANRQPELLEDCSVEAAFTVIRPLSLPSSENCDSEND